MLKHLRCQTWVVRLTIGLICPWILSGCTMWNGFSDRSQVTVSLSEAEMESFGAKLRHLNGDAESRYNMGLHYQKQDQHQWAIEEFEKAIAIDPHHARGYNAIGVSYDNLGNYAAAQKAYLHALEIDAKMDCVWNNLGYSAMLQGNPEEAVAHYRKALALNENNLRYRNNLLLAKAQLPADTLLAADDTPSAMTAADKTASPSDNLHYAADRRDNLWKPAASSPNPSAEDTIGKIDRNDIALPAHGKQAKPAAKGPTSQESKGTTGATGSVTIITEAPARSINSFDVVEALAKLGNDFRQIVQTAPNDGSNNPQGKTRVVTVQTAGSQENGFQFTVKPVLKTRARPVENGGVATVLSLAMPGVGLSNIPLMAASIRSQLQVSEKLERKIADAEGAYIKVVNGNGVNGMARRVGRYLARRGFTVGHPANADHFSHRNTVLYFPPGYQHEAQALAEAIPGYQEMKESAAMPNHRARITLRIGRDIVQYQDMFNKG